MHCFRAPPLPRSRNSFSLFLLYRLRSKGLLQLDEKGDVPQATVGDAVVRSY